MINPLDKSVVSPLLIGCHAELESLAHWLALARQRQGQTVLVGGEAGVGKSRLVAELKLRARTLNFTILEGHAFQPDQALPYAPLRDLLRAFLESRPAGLAAHEMGDSAPELARLLPEWGTRLPETVAPARSDPEAERRRLFRALAQFFKHLAE